MPRTVESVIPAGTMAAVAQPTLEVDATLSLRPWRVEDAPVILAAFADPDIQHWHGFRVDSLDEARTWIETANSLWRDDKSAGWAMSGADDTVLGRIAIHADFRTGNAEIAYWVLPDARLQGVAVRSVNTVTQWAHDWLGVHRILLQHSTQNEASCAVARRAGYVVEGTSRQQDLHVDGWHDMHQHAHVRGD